MAKLLEEKGVKQVVLADLTREDMAEAISNAFRFAKIVLASSSYNSGIFPPMEQFLHHLEGKNYQNRKIGIIENGTWAPSAGKCIKSILDNMKDITICEPMVTIKSRMNEETQTKMEELAKEII